MNFRTARLILLLLLLTIWADRLKIGAFYVTPHFGTTAFGQEIYPLSMRDRAETRETVEAPPLARIQQQPLLIALIAPCRPCLQPESADSSSLSRSNACYLFMSIQR
jgi:hypothetical protein